MKWGLAWFAAPFRRLGSTVALLKAYDSAKTADRLVRDQWPGQLKPFHRSGMAALAAFKADTDTTEKDQK